MVLIWNGRQYLPDYLNSLEGQTLRDYYVVLVDNAPPKALRVFRG